MKMQRYAVNVPVRRKLFACSAAYLCGIYAARAAKLPVLFYGLAGVLFLAAGILRLKQRKSALVFVMAALMMLGGLRITGQLRIRDSATLPGTAIAGTVIKKESNYRVYLDDVMLEGQTLKRPVLVTLMLADEAAEDVPVPPAIGQRIEGIGRLFEQEEKRNPGGIDKRIQALCDGYDLSGYVLSGWKTEGKAVFSLWEWFREAQIWLSERIGWLFGEDAPLFQAIMIGDRRGMDADVIQAMRLTGVAHLLTVSGMHLTLMALALRRCLSALRAGPKRTFAVLAVLLGAYTCITGFAAGTVRAYIMVMLRELARRSGRQYDPMTALGAAALVMTLIRPVWALSASFQFSFFVVLGILLLSAQVERRLKGNAAQGGRFSRIRKVLALSASAQFAAMPMQLALYGYIPLLALPVNLICGAMMPLMMLGGWGTLLAGLIFAPLGQPMARAVGLCAQGVQLLSTAAGAGIDGILRLPAPGMGLVGVFALFMMAISSRFYIQKHRKVLCGLLIAVIILGYIPRFYVGEQYVQMDVGQGDAALFRKGRHAVLVDVGPAQDYAMLRYLRHEGLYVDLVVLSHLDEDHAGALDVLLGSEIEIERVAMPVGALEDAGSETVLMALETARERGIEIKMYQKGDRIETDIVALDVLSPEPHMQGSNERSLALYAQMSGLRVLTLGDLPTDCEMEEIPPCDVLKVAHHGSAYATSSRLIEKAGAKAAVISVGRNNYGHPSSRVLQDLEAAGTTIYRTDTSGCITVRAAAGKYGVLPFVH